MLFAICNASAQATALAFTQDGIERWWENGGAGAGRHGHWADKRSSRMQTNSKHITMDGDEVRLLEKYEKQFGETPPIAFLDPKTSKRMMKKALLENLPFNESDIEDL